jgi:hypothetical protein
MVSSTMSLPKSAGVIGIAGPPISLNRLLNLGSASTEFMAWLSLATISGEVPLGATTLT